MQLTHVLCAYTENTAARLESKVRFAEVVEVVSPGAWRRSEVGVARSAAGKGPDRTPGSGSQSPTVRDKDGVNTGYTHPPTPLS